MECYQKRGRSHEFSKLTDDEVTTLEAVIRETFEHFENDNKALDHVTSSEA
jgi:hypothetical protein